MSPLLKLSALISAVNRALFRAAAWLAVALVGVYFAVALLRYVFGWGSVALQEFGIYLHAALFMLAIAAGLPRDTHVRVDIFYARFSPRGKALVNLLGSLLLALPFALFLLWASWDYVAHSWALGETSVDAGGLAYVWLLKTLIPVLAVMLALQALASAVTHAHELRKGDH